MSEQYDNTNTGVLFKNKPQDGRELHPKAPGYKGKIDVNGTEFRISAWLKESRKTGEKFFSLKIEPLENDPHGTRGNPTQPAVKSNRIGDDFADDEDSIAF